jgi:hypothetical protein
VLYTILLIVVFLAAVAWGWGCQCPYCGHSNRWPKWLFPVCQRCLRDRTRHS